MDCIRFCWTNFINSCNRSMYYDAHHHSCKHVSSQIISLDGPNSSVCLSEAHHHGTCCINSTYPPTAYIIFQPLSYWTNVRFFLWFIWSFHIQQFNRASEEKKNSKTKLLTVKFHELCHTDNYTNVTLLKRLIKTKQFTFNNRSIAD